MLYKKITDINLNNKIVFIRTDMNVPIQNNQIIDDTRIKAGLKTIEYALKCNAKVIIATHLGRPVEGSCTEKDSTNIIADRLSKLLGHKINFIKDFSYGINFTDNNIAMLQNVRCNIGEKQNSLELGKSYANLCDVFIHDAFATAHRAESSTDAIGKYAKEVGAGFLMSSEIDALNKAFTNPKRPIMAIIGGSKISTKLSLLDKLADNVDYLIVGGGILNTFLLAAGFNVAKSLVETDLVKEAKHIINKMEKRGAAVPLPKDVIVAKECSTNAIAINKNIDNVNNDDMILDIGSSFAHELAQIITNCNTIIWNGPIGVFELDQFANGTKFIANAIAHSSAFSLAGGGDTIAAINKFNLYDKISYISTAGGALLEFLEGKKLPAISLLEERAQ